MHLFEISSSLFVLCFGFFQFSVSRFVILDIVSSIFYLFSFEEVALADAQVTVGERRIVGNGFLKISDCAFVVVAFEAQRTFQIVENRILGIFLNGFVQNFRRFIHFLAFDIITNQRVQRELTFGISFKRIFQEFSVSLFAFCFFIYVSQQLIACFSLILVFDNFQTLSCFSLSFCLYGCICAIIASPDVHRVSSVDFTLHKRQLRHFDVFVECIE